MIILLCSYVPTIPPLQGGGGSSSTILQNEGIMNPNSYVDPLGVILCKNPLHTTERFLEALLAEFSHRVEQGLLLFKG